MAVGQDQALGALAVGAKDPLGGAVLGVAPERPDSVGEEGGSDGLALPGCVLAALPGEREGRTFLDGEDGMGFDTVLGHWCAIIAQRAVRGPSS